MKRLYDRLPTESLSDLYQTSDLGTAVFLFVTGHELIRTSLIGPNRLSFHFKHTRGIEQAVESYLNGQAQAPARRLFEGYRQMRAIAFEKTGNLR